MASVSPFPVSRTHFKADGQEAETVSRICAIGDVATTQSTLSPLLSTTFLTLDCYLCPRDFIDHNKAQPPACILLDLYLPGTTGLETLAQFRRKGIVSPVIILATYCDVETAVLALKQGAFDFIEKPLSPMRLLQSVQKATSESRDKLAKHHARQVYKERIQRLTGRERQVLELVLEGATSKDIAKSLDISPRTAENHRAHIMTKLGESSTIRLARVLTELGILPALSTASVSKFTHDKE